jgi:hypothetical protein
MTLGGFKPKHPRKESAGKNMAEKSDRRPLPPMSRRSDHQHTLFTPFDQVDHYKPLVVNGSSGGYLRTGWNYVLL